MGGHSGTGCADGALESIRIAGGAGVLSAGDCWARGLVELEYWRGLEGVPRECGELRGGFWG
jgi:hypothetical protein